MVTLALVRKKFITRICLLLQSLVFGDLAAVVAVKETQVGGNWFGHPVMKEELKKLSTYHVLISF